MAKSEKVKTSKTSKGERDSVSRKLCAAMRRSRTPGEKMIFKMLAWTKGKQIKGYEHWGRYSRYYIPKEVEEQRENNK